ncbi:hypothetical protein C8F04DRAFT_1278212 [Mycena alexandri]|uniref:Uncharacterized protein n=1 Tax=Mycena alexandri TaxID=1745969 RepID=A0AAD6RZM9_9AGAR|nr:hypothetical protein C8F04DRAFT_1278212 [Mycena alexandri]
MSIVFPPSVLNNPENRPALHLHAELAGLDEYLSGDRAVNAFEWSEFKSGQIMRVNRNGNSSADAMQYAYFVIVATASTVDAKVSTVGDFRLNNQYAETPVKARFRLRLVRPAHEVWGPLYDEALKNAHQLVSRVCPSSSYLFGEFSGGEFLKLSKVMFEAKEDEAEFHLASTAWPVPSWARSAFTAACADHHIQPLRVFDQQRDLVPPAQVATIVPGSLLQATFRLKYSLLRKGTDITHSINADIAQLLILEPARPPPPNPFIGRAPHQPSRASHIAQPMNQGPRASSATNSVTARAQASLPHIPNANGIDQSMQHDNSQLNSPGHQQFAPPLGLGYEDGAGSSGTHPQRRQLSHAQSAASLGGMRPEPTFTPLAPPSIRTHTGAARLGGPPPLPFHTHHPLSTIPTAARPSTPSGNHSQYPSSLTPPTPSLPDTAHQPQYPPGLGNRPQYPSHLRPQPQSIGDAGQQRRYPPGLGNQRPFETHAASSPTQYIRAPVDGSRVFIDYNIAMPHNHLRHHDRSPHESSQIPNASSNVQHAALNANGAPAGGDSTFQLGTTSTIATTHGRSVAADRYHDSMYGGRARGADTATIGLPGTPPPRPPTTISSLHAPVRMQTPTQPPRLAFHLERSSDGELVNQPLSTTSDTPIDPSMFYCAPGDAGGSPTLRTPPNRPPTVRPQSPAGQMRRTSGTSEPAVRTYHPVPSRPPSRPVSQTARYRTTQGATTAAQMTMQTSQFVDEAALDQPSPFVGSALEQLSPFNDDAPLEPPSTGHIATPSRPPSHGPTPDYPMAPLWVLQPAQLDSQSTELPLASTLLPAFQAPSPSTSDRWGHTDDPLGDWHVRLSLSDLAASSSTTQGSMPYSVNFIASPTLQTPVWEGEYDRTPTFAYPLADGSFAPYLNGNTTGAAAGSDSDSSGARTSTTEGSGSWESIEYSGKEHSVVNGSWAPSDDTTDGPPFQMAFDQLNARRDKVLGKRRRVFDDEEGERIIHRPLFFGVEGDNDIPTME